MVVPLGFEPRSEDPEPSMMDRYTKGLLSGPRTVPSSIQRFIRNGKKQFIGSEIMIEAAGGYLIRDWFVRKVMNDSVSLK